MIDASRVLLMWISLVGLGGILAVAFARFVYCVVVQRIGERFKRVFRNGLVPIFIPAVCAYGLIVYGSSKGNAHTNAPSSQTDSVGETATEAEESATSGCDVGLSLIETWYRRGGRETGHVVTFDEGWCFPFRTNHLARIEVWATGAIYPSEKDSNPVAQFLAPLSLKPQETRVMCGRTRANSYRVEWYDAHPIQNPGLCVNAAIELHRNGCVTITEGGLSTVVPYEIPYLHDGFGQDEDWVRANFMDAEAINVIGYANWVDAQIGVGLENGRYKFTAVFDSVPPEPTQLYVGEYSVCVTNAGSYVFVLEKGVEYEFGTWPFNEEIVYCTQDDMAEDSPMLTAWLGNCAPLGEWSTDGGWNSLVYPSMDCHGSCIWMPTLQGSPGITHLAPTDFPAAFEAILTDYGDREPPSFYWTASDEAIQLATPHSQTTTVACASLPSWGLLSLSVEADMGGFSLWSYVDATYGTNTTPQVHLSLDVPEGLALGGERRKLTAIFNADVATNGCMMLRCVKAADKISLWSAPTNGVLLANSNCWSVVDKRSVSCYVQGVALSDYEGVEFELAYIPNVGNGMSVRAKSTVFACYTQPVSEITHRGFEVVNPCFMNAQSDMVFRVEVDPGTIPSSKICWRTIAGTVSSMSGTNGTQIVVRGANDDVDLEIEVLGATDDRMHLRSRVVQQGE